MIERHSVCRVVYGLFGFFNVTFNMLLGFNLWSSHISLTVARVSLFFLTLKVNNARGVLCDITNQNKSVQVGHLLMLN